MQTLWNQFINSSRTIKLTALIILLAWAATLGLLGCSLGLEQPVLAEPPAQGVSNASIQLDPPSGPVGALVTVTGRDWPAGQTVLLYLAAPDQTEVNGYALSSAETDQNGYFQTTLLVPVLPGQTGRTGLARIAAKTPDGLHSAGLFFNLTAAPTITPTVVIAPTHTPTVVVVEPSPAPIQQPASPSVTSLTDLNIRSGPGTGYNILGQLRTGQTAAVTGISPDGRWWQIAFNGAASGRGWVSGQYVSALDTANVPLVQPPALPATPTPTPTPPVVITDWRGEYFDNPTLSGNPALVRNDPTLAFSWGPNAPAPGLPGDRFSVRWTRSPYFSAGTYRFDVLVDDGARLWVDNNLVIDRWVVGPPTTYSGQITLSEGTHALRLEYFDERYDAQVRLSWTRNEGYPDWKAEYFNNRKLDGRPVLVRNEKEIDHNWRTSSPDPAIPADNFSARWTRRADFREATYRFRVKADDGVRLWVDGNLVIDHWQDGSAHWIEVDRRLSRGEYTVKVEYYERSGGAEIEVDWKRLEEPANQPPQAAAGGPYLADEGSLITFDGRNSRDPDGQITRYEWDFDYDGRTFNSRAEGAQASNRYPDGPASFQVALRVTDDRGATHIATAQVSIRNVAPLAEAGGPYPGLAGSPITLAGTGSDAGSTDQAGLTYRWDFGDGQQANGPVVSHSYAQPGSYTVQLTVTDKDGAQGRDTATVQVVRPNQPPQAVLSGPTHGVIDEPLSFSGWASTDSDGEIVGYAWDFGEGTTASGSDVTHRYAASGRYRVTLTVTDDGDLSSSASVMVEIDEPVQVNLPPEPVINGPDNGQVGQELAFNAQGSFDPDGTIVSYVWDFGDGTTADGVEVGHVYQQAGQYEIVLTVTDNDDLTGQTSQIVQINE